jgi:hypothetical protein
MKIKQLNKIQSILYRMADYQGQLRLVKEDDFGHAVKEQKVTLMQYNEHDHSLILRPTQGERFEFDDGSVRVSNGLSNIQFDVQVLKQHQHLLKLDAPGQLELVNHREFSRLDLLKKNVLVEFSNLSQISYDSHHSTTYRGVLIDVSKGGIGLKVPKVNVQQLLIESNDQLQFFQLQNRLLEQKCLTRVRHKQELTIGGESVMIIGLQFEKGSGHEFFSILSEA